MTASSYSIPLRDGGQSPRPQNVVAGARMMPAAQFVPLDLTRTQRRIWNVLHGRFGEFVAPVEIKRGMGNADAISDTLLRAHVHALRRQIDNTPVCIDFVRGRGYALRPIGEGHP